MVFHFHLQPSLLHNKTPSSVCVWVWLMFIPSGPVTSCSCVNNGSTHWAPLLPNSDKDTLYRDTLNCSQYMLCILTEKHQNKLTVTQSHAPIPYYILMVYRIFYILIFIVYCLELQRLFNLINDYSVNRLKVTRQLFFNNRFIVSVIFSDDWWDRIAGKTAEGYSMIRSDLEAMQPS